MTNQFEFKEENNKLWKSIKTRKTILTCPTSDRLEISKRGVKTGESYQMNFGENDLITSLTGRRRLLVTGSADANPTTSPPNPVP